MPVFFFVGGFANLVTIDGQRRKGMGVPEYLVGRAQRLVRPVAVLFAVWIPLAIALVTFGVDRELLGDATKVVCQPLWFVGVYLMVSALAPPMRDLHARFRFQTPVALVALAVAIDIARFAFDVPAVGWLNILFVWLFAQQLGFFYADGTLTKFTPQQLAGTATAALVRAVRAHDVRAVPAQHGRTPRRADLEHGAADDLPHRADDPAGRARDAPAPRDHALAATREAVDDRRRRQRRDHDDLPLAPQRDAVLGRAAVPARLPATGRWHRGVVDHAPAVDPRRRDPARRDRRRCSVASNGPKPTQPATRSHTRRHSIASIGTALLAIGISGIATGTLGDLVHGTSRLVLVDITPLQSMTIAATGWLLLRASVTQQPEVERRVSSTPLPGA